MRLLPFCAVFMVLGAGQAFAGAAEGKVAYDAKCKMCHKADGSGMAAMHMRALSSPEVQAKSDADLKDAVSKGTGKMKPVTLTPAQLDDVVAYVRTLKK